MLGVCMCVSNGRFKCRQYISEAGGVVAAEHRQRQESTLQQPRNLPSTLLCVGTCLDCSSHPRPSICVFTDQNMHTDHVQFQPFHSPLDGICSLSVESEVAQSSFIDLKRFV